MNLSSFGLFVLHLLLVPLAPLCAADYWVAPGGQAGNPGTQAQPWSLAYAGTAAQAGDIVHVTAGVYSERLVVEVSGSAVDGLIHFLADPGAIIDGTGITSTTGDFEGLVHLDSVHHVRVEGLEIREWKTPSANRTPVGIYVQSDFAAVTDVQIVDNHVHDIWQLAGNGGAHGIGIYGGNPTPISGLLIQGNEVDHCRLGWSEALVVNGNVDGFEISGNSVHDCNNIGIDLIGYEDTAPTGSPDYARNGSVSGNTVYAIHTGGYDASSANAAYALGDDSAGGIYVDGARDVLIERNDVHDCDIGIEIGAEHTGDRNSLRVTVRNNLIHTTIQGCIQLGGYDTNLSWAEDCEFIHNTCFRADTKNQGYGTIQLQKSRNCTFSHNLLLATGAAAGDTDLHTVAANMGVAHIFGHSFDWNLHHATQGSPRIRVVQGVDFSGVAAFQIGAGQEANGLEASPGVGSLASPIDLELQTGSVAIDSGDPAFVADLGETGIGGQPRVSGARTDLGAYEFVPQSALTAFCFADGGAHPGGQLGCTPCPCSNDAASGTEGGCLNSNGTSARLVASGSPSIGVPADTLRFEVVGAASSSFGVLVSAMNLLPNVGPCLPGSGIPAFDGLRCVGGALQRHGTRATDGNGEIGVQNNGWGAPDGPVGGLGMNGGFVAGQTRQFQCFYRDDVSAVCESGQNTTNGVSVVFE